MSSVKPDPTASRLRALSAEYEVVVREVVAARAEALSFLRKLDSDSKRKRSGDE